MYQNSAVQYDGLCSSAGYIVIVNKTRSSLEPDTVLCLCACVVAISDICSINCF